MSWTYNVMLKTFKHNGVYEFRARYAGAPGYKDNPEYECLKEQGPLPRGKYRIVGVPFTHKKAGLFTLRLEPDKNNSMCGRSGFLIHGDSKTKPGTASNGCIVLDPKFRERIWQSGDKELIVE
ncbi:tlde1 domain-containing protein [Kalamiella sp. sgz302252]|uniref:tlde1 domain-containing protein n=1 Tax=Pantoea sp. sgz302252 TaxID=3341827 RepID=UPI0036D259FD